MTVIIDLKSEVKQSGDLDRLESMLGALVGQRCMRVELSYGEELMLHLGTPMPYSSPKLADETKGSWIIGTRASHWNLLLSGPPLLIVTGGEQSNGLRMASSTGASEEIERRGRVVYRMHHHRRQARVALPTGGSYGRGRRAGAGVRQRLAPCHLPDGRPDDGTPLADWELFTPYDMYLACGPGPVWSYLRSDVAASNK